MKQGGRLCSQMLTVPTSENGAPTACRTPETISPKWKWDSMSMNFVVGLPLTQWKNNAIWVIMDKLSKTANFIGRRNTWTLAQLAYTYLEEIIRLHGVPPSIVSDRDTRFLLGFCRSYRKC